MFGIGIPELIILFLIIGVPIYLFRLSRKFNRKPPEVKDVLFSNKKTTIAGKDVGPNDIIEALGKKSKKAAKIFAEKMDTKTVVKVLEEVDLYTLKESGMLEYMDIESALPKIGTERANMVNKFVDNIKAEKGSLGTSNISKESEKQQFKNKDEFVDLDSSGTSLREAIAGNDISLVKSLIENGADVDDTEGSEYGSPLHKAVISGNVEIAKLLLDAGANINFQNEDIGATPLMKAIETEQIEMIKYILERGADVNIANVDGARALMYARCMGEDKKDEIVALLLAAGSKNAVSY